MISLLLQQSAQKATRMLGGHTDNWLAIATQFVQEKGEDWWNAPQAPYNAGNVRDLKGNFLEFPNLDAGVQGYVNFLLNDPDGYYTDVRNAIRTGAPHDVLVALSKSPYCDPPYPLASLEGVFKIVQEQAFGSAPKTAYPPVTAQVYGHPMEAYAIQEDGTDVTYVLWTALDILHTPYAYKGNGVMEVNGTDVQGVIIHGDTFLPWGCLAQGIKAVGLPGGGWNFVVDQVAPTPAPAPVPTPTPQPTTDRQVVATIQGDVDRNAYTFHFTPEAKMPNGTFSGMGKMLLDTGAACPLIDQSMATAFQLSKGKDEVIAGVTGNASAFDTSVALKFGDEVFENQFAIVDPTYQSFDNGLFGLRFFIDNKLNIDLDLETGTLTLYRKVTK